MLFQQELGRVGLSLSPQVCRRGKLGKELPAQRAAGCVEHRTLFWGDVLAAVRRWRYGVVSASAGARCEPSETRFVQRCWFHTLKASAGKKHPLSRLLVEAVRCEVGAGIANPQVRA